MPRVLDAKPVTSISPLSLSVLSVAVLQVFDGDNEMHNQAHRCDLQEFCIQNSSNGHPVVAHIEIARKDHHLLRIASHLRLEYHHLFRFLASDF